MTLRHRGTIYEITVRNPDKVSSGVVALELDGAAHPLTDGTARIVTDETFAPHAHPPGNVVKRALLVTLGKAGPH